MNLNNIIENYNECRSGSFHFFCDNNQLSNVCKAPKDASGVYLFHDVKNDEIIYIGCSGSIQNNGDIKCRDGGIYDRLVNGKQFEEKRHKSLPKKMKEEGISELKIQWIETFNKQVKHSPTYVEALLLQAYFDEHTCLPKWNKEF